MSEKRLGQLGERVPESLSRAEEEGRLKEAVLADYLHLSTGQLDDVGSLVGTDA